MKKTIIKTLPNEFAEWWGLNKRPLMSLDFETTSLNYLDMQPVGLSMSNGDKACYCPFYEMIDFDDYAEALNLRDIVKEIDTVIMHNSVYDLKCCYKFFGFMPKNIICTMVAAKLLNENLGKGSYSLKKLAHSELGVPESEIVTWEKASKFGQDSEQFANYGMNDAIWPYQLWEKFAPEIEKQDLSHVFYDVEMPFQKVLADLEINGVKVEKDKLLDTKKLCANKLYQLECEMLESIGMKHDVEENLFGEFTESSPINFTAPQQIVKVAQEVLNINLTEKTKPSKTYPEGQYKMDNEVIDSLKNKYQFFSLFARYRKLNTLWKTFISPCDTYIDSDDRIRASYHLVRTGRLSCSQPNLQNLPNPKREKLEFNHRKIFIPENGNVFVKADWSGQELRVLADESGDRRMTDAFWNNIDLHLLTANNIFNLGISDSRMVQTDVRYRELCDKYAQERYKAKNGVNFPIIYGKTEYTLATDFDISVKEAKKWMDDYFGLYPSVKTAIRLTEVELEKQEYVVNMMGRRRRFPGYNNGSKWEKQKMLRQAFNFKIQGFSAEMFKLAASRMRNIALEYGAKLVMVIHDEVIYEVAEDKTEEFSLKLKDVMEHIVKLSVPVCVDISIVPSYGD